VGGLGCVKCCHKRVVGCLTRPRQIPHILRSMNYSAPFVPLFHPQLLYHAAYIDLVNEFCSMYLTRWLRKIGSQIVVISNYCVVASILFIFSCNQDDATFLLKAQNVGGTTIYLDWSHIEGNDGYKIWRLDEMVNPSVPELRSTVNDLRYLDGDLPLSASLSYYVTTKVNGRERRSNVISVAGRSSLNIVPLRMKAIPGKDIAIVQEDEWLILLDFHKKNIIKKIEFYSMGQFDLQTYNGELELYVPGPGYSVYIMKADDLTPIDTLHVGRHVIDVAVSNTGKIFCATADFMAPLEVYRREDLEHVEDLRTDIPCSIDLRDDNHVIAVTTSLSPGTMSFFTLDEVGRMISRKDNPYDWFNGMDAWRMEVSDKFMVMSTHGIVYTADENMTYIATVSNSSNLADFEFSADGATIYSTQTDQKSILKSTIVNNVAKSETISTAGYPWVLSRNGNTLFILSAPEPFSPYFTGDVVTIETIALP